MSQLSLHEQYETLLRRGMPEHPRLYFHTRTGEAGDYWPHIDGLLQETDDARDLITMHALRWALGVLPTHKYAGRSSAEAAGWHPDERTVYYVGRLREVFDSQPFRFRNNADDILEAILAVTEHLEGR